MLNEDRFPANTTWYIAGLRNGTKLQPEGMKFLWDPWSVWEFHDETVFKNRQGDLFGIWKIVSQPDEEHVKVEVNVHNYGTMTFLFFDPQMAAQYDGNGAIQKLLARNDAF
jgi:hypothetical protein